jgi:hypothetical protein
MPTYRIYLLNKDNHITRVEQVAYPTDHDALTRGLELIDDGHRAEIWHSLRLVAMLAATKSELV